MGYPMTYSRILDRNGLKDGDYDTPPERWFLNAPATAWSIMENRSSKEEILAHGKHLEEIYKEHCKRVQGRITMLTGDLRRLEKDTLDEGTTVQTIAAQTGVDTDTVAAVLRAFIAW
jgi:hypothetical protein